MSPKLLGFAAIGIAVGVGFTLQAVINGRLSRYIGVVEATFINITGAWICITILLLLRFGSTRMGELPSAPPYLFTGGIFAFFALLAIISLVPIIGPGNVNAAIIAGQLLAGVAFDHFGVLGMPRVPIDPVRVGGLVVMLVGVRMILR